MNFNLFGFERIPEDKIFGFWLFSIRHYEYFNRSLFGIHYESGAVRLHVAYMEWIFYPIERT